MNITELQTAVRELSQNEFAEFAEWFNEFQDALWDKQKLKYKLGQFLLGQVEYHAPFGVFVNIGEDGVKGLIKIPDFLDEGEMSEEMYPEIGSVIGAIVVGYNEANCREVYLNAKPSVLHEIFVPLRSRPVMV